MKAMPEPSHIKFIVDALYKILGANTAYVVHYRDAMQSESLFPCEFDSKQQTPHFDLVVFSRRTGDGLHNAISNYIAHKSSGAVTANVLLHKTHHLRTQSADMQWFFDRVLRHGMRVCEDEHHFPIAKTNSEPERHFEGAIRFFHKCEAVACVYLDAASQSPMLDVEIAKISLLTQATEYVLLGLIRIFWGYIPNEFNLKFLFALSRSFTNTATRVFELHSEAGQRCFRHLCAPATMLRHWDNLKVSEPDFDFLLCACERFRRDAAHLVQQHLDNQSTILRI